MFNRVLLTVIVLLGAAPAAATHRHRSARRLPLLQEHGAVQRNQVAEVSPATGADLVVAPLPPMKVIPTFVEFHSGRVEHDLMLFPPTLVGLTPPGRARDAELFASPPAKKRIRYFAPAKTADDLAVRRDRDKLLLFRGPQPQGAAVGVGLAMFGATTLLSAHAPRPLRIIFDGPVHLGPAVFDGGGMGAGIAGRAF